MDEFIASEMQQIDAGGDAGAASKPTMRPSGAGVSGTGTKSVTSKPNFGMSAGKKAGGSFAKPSFAMKPGSKKTVLTGPSLGGPSMMSKGSAGGVPKITLKRKRDDDDFIENELAQISSQ